MSRFVAEISSSNGLVKFDTRTGIVLECKEYEKCEGSLSHIVRFDVDEFFKTYPGETPETLERCDILDIGFTYVGRAGTVGYEHPAYAWREEREELRREANGETIPAG